MKSLYIIPARGGSKGIPKKNLKNLNGKPLITYSIDTARNMTTDDHICITTDDDEIISCVKEYGMNVPFKRPAHLAQDESGAEGYILHALEYYKQKGLTYDAVVLLQPTSPFRKKNHIQEALSIYNNSYDMVVSVCETKANPAYNLYKENTDGFLESYEKSNLVRRQDAPVFYEYNGSIYIINCQSLLRSKSIGEFKTVKKYVMDDLYSTDIDSPLDFLFCEFLLNKKQIEL